MSIHRKDALQEKRCVILKGRREGISVFLDDKADFGTIKAVLRNRVASARNFFDGAKSAVTFKGRKLSEQEEKILLDIIQFETNMNVESEEIRASNGEAFPSIYPPGLKPEAYETFYYRGSVRGGQIIQQSGSVVIMGDVNPGAEVKATGNIIVLGALRGLAWAGAPPDDMHPGDSKCFVSAVTLHPTQIRINRVVTYIPEEEIKGKYENGAWAYIQDQRVYVAPL